MAHWGQNLPLKWILLEHLIEINKSDGNNFINLSDMENLAKHPDINMIDIDEVKLFLRYQHEVGNIIYFEDIQDFIILNPKWLVDAFRCLVSDKIDGRLQHRTDWTKQNGTISESLITELFKSKCGNQFLDQKENLVKVMEKFDILVKIAETSSYIMPSMMPPVLFDEAVEDLVDKLCLLNVRVKDKTFKPGQYLGTQEVRLKVKIVTNIETIVNDPNFIPIITY
ncbi:unnamed protein product [Mytilus edulis]|uniref:COR domain-containing protein n=1 Tax=Mytilus edulis TaxID=6550 RepID=A0A8S3UKH7_MYTED|nr:unnamed protein product [Mytilus edulis]